MAEVEKPAPDAGEVLVKVLATSVNAADWYSMRGKPLFSRATLGLLRPKHKILGVDIAGQVEAVGSGVIQFKPGDEVYANLLFHGYGGFAEYVSVPVDVMSLKPANLSFEEAAAVPMAAVTALQGLRHHGEIQPEPKVLIDGASGGVGTFAVQIDHIAAQTDLSGILTPGRGLGAARLADSGLIDRLQQLVGFPMVLGTLNVRPSGPIERSSNWRYLAAAEISSDWESETGQAGYFLAPVRVAERYRCVAFQADEPGYPADQIELVCEVHIRSTLGLSDGDPISLSVIAMDSGA